MSDLNFDSLSPVGLGCNNFGMRLDLEQSRAVIDTAIECGITFFDTADVYGGTQSETFLGQVLGSRRDQIVLATKFGVRAGDVAGGLRAADVHRSAEDSLRRLNTSHIDLLMVHYPSSFMIAQNYPDPDVPVAETLDALDQLVSAGKVRAIGCSNFSLEELRDADDTATRTGTTRFAAIQNEMSVLVRGPEADILPYCDAHDTVFLPFFPLASGLLTGKYTDPGAYPEGSRMAWASDRMWGRLFTPANYAAAHKLKDYAEARNHTLLELAFGWLLAHPAIPTVIGGATTPEQVRTNVESGTWTLTPDEMTNIATLLSPPAPN